MTLLVDRLTLTFLSVDSFKETQLFYYYLVSFVLWWIPISPTVIKWYKNSFGLQLNNAKHSSEVVPRLHLWSIMVIPITHLENSFFLSKLSFNIETSEHGLSNLPSFFGNTICMCSCVMSFLHFEEIPISEKINNLWQIVLIIKLSFIKTLTNIINLSKLPSLTISFSLYYSTYELCKIYSSGKTHLTVPIALTLYYNIIWLTLQIPHSTAT